MVLDSNQSRDAERIARHNDEGTQAMNEQFKPGDRVYHRQLEQYGTVLPAFPDHETTTVQFDDGEARRVTTDRLRRA